MKFGPVPVADAVGAILAHSVRHPGGVIRKGRMLGDSDIAALRAAGIADVVVAHLEPDDIHEDAAAEQIARAVAGANLRVEHPFTGRANIYAECAGVFTVARDVIDGINRVDPAITLATLKEYAAVEAGQMVATVKIIPFAVGQGSVWRALQGAQGPVIARGGLSAAQGRAGGDDPSGAEIRHSGQDPAAAGCPSQACRRQCHAGGSGRRTTRRPSPERSPNRRGTAPNC